MWALEFNHHHWQWPAGAWVGISGPSGCGKTRLLSALASGQQGTLTDNGQSLLRRPAGRRGIGWVTQGALLWPSQTVEKQLTHLALRHDFGDFRALADELGVTPLLAQTTATLSGGERQRVAALAALLCAHTLLILDEPVSALDEEGARQVLGTLRRHARTHNLSALLVSHQWRDLAAHCDHCYLWSDRRLLTITEAHHWRVQQHPQAAAAVLPIEARENGRVSIAGHILEAGPLPANTERVYIDAHEVSVARQRPGQSSIANTLRATITTIEPAGPHSQVVRLNWCGHALYALVTPRAVEQLALTQGLEVFAQFKAHALKPA